MTRGNAVGAEVVQADQTAQATESADFGVSGEVTADVAGAGVGAGEPSATSGGTDAGAGDQAVAVHLVTLGCARNEVDSEELAARLGADDYRLVDDPNDADVIMVNTCGFIEQAKKDSVDTLLAAADTRRDGTRPKVIAVGCMAQRYGAELAQALPEADAVLGFDDYPEIADRVRTVLAGGTVAPPTPGDRRTLLPITPVSRHEVASQERLSVPGHGDVTEVGGAGDGATGQSGAGVVLGDGLTGVTPGEGVGAGEVPTPPTGPRVLRRRLGNQPYAPLKIASGCDRRCAFCAIPTFRGSYLSRPADDIIAEANWLVGEGVREAMLVSENSSSYGKDWSDPNALVSLLRRLNDVPGLDWVRVSYLQPAEIRPGLIEEMIALDHVVNYFDLSFQHASASVLRRMRRFGDPQSFLNLIEMIRQGAPEAGIRTNVIVGFPGETDDDVATLVDFLTEARLDVVGVFAYSDEEGTEGERLPGHCDPAEIAERRDYVATVVDELCNQRAEERIGTVGQLLIESIDAENGIVGRMAHQGPEVDGQTVVVGAGGEGAGVASGAAGVRDGEPVDVVDGVGGAHVRGLKVGDIVTVRVVDSYGVDLTAELV